MVQRTVLHKAIIDALNRAYHRLTIHQSILQVPPAGGAGGASAAWRTRRDHPGVRAAMKCVSLWGSGQQDGTTRLDVRDLTRPPCNMQSETSGAASREAEGPGRPEEKMAAASASHHPSSRFPRWPQ